jgi:hypothetical protein
MTLILGAAGLALVLGGCVRGERERHMASRAALVEGTAGSGEVRLVLWPWTVERSAMAHSSRATASDSFEER